MSTVNKNPHAVALGRLGRKKNTPAQQEAARENGKKGGRPKKSAIQKEKQEGKTCAYGNCRYWGVNDGYCSKHKRHDA